MNIDAFVNANDSARIYECTYYHDPTRWNSIPKDTKEILNSQKWSGYIKYLDPEGNVSDAIKNLPNNEGGIYIFFIQGPTLPSAEMYIAYIGRALFTDGQNIKKELVSIIGKASVITLGLKFLVCFGIGKIIYMLNIFLLKIMN